MRVGMKEDRKATRFGLGDDACMVEIVGLALCLARSKIHTKGADRIIQYLRHNKGCVYVLTTPSKRVSR
jgi:hypothetical protein